MKSVAAFSISLVFIAATPAMPRLNHMFQTAVKGAASEYVQIAETVAPAALQGVSEWMLEKAG